MAKKLKIIERKLGREKLDGDTVIGLSYDDEKLIEIEPRLSKKLKFKVLLHELIHQYQPELSETKVLYLERKIGNPLWKAVQSIIKENKI